MLESARIGRTASPCLAEHAHANLPSVRAKLTEKVVFKPAVSRISYLCCDSRPASGLRCQTSALRQNPGCRRARHKSGVGLLPGLGLSNCQTS